MTGQGTWDVGFDRDGFLRLLIGELTGALERIAGPEEATGYLSLVGQLLGERVGARYAGALAAGRLTREQVALALADIKRRIGGETVVLAQDDGKIVLGSRACPFAGALPGQAALCAITSHMLGVIAAQNLGYARVEAPEAAGHPACRTVVHLSATPEALAAPGCDYYGDVPQPGVAPAGAGTG